MQCILQAAALFLFTAATAAQTYTISTFAGGGLPVNILGSSASIGFDSRLAVDSTGSVYIACHQYNSILRLDAKSGLLTLFAGNGTPGFSGDGGPATSAQLNFGQTYKGGGLAIDATGALYIADTTNRRIRKVSGGIISTVAGSAKDIFVSDLSGPALEANFSYPNSLAIDQAGNLYILDYPSSVWKLSKGQISLAIGSPNAPGSTADNVPANKVALKNPRALAVNPSGELYIADDDLVRKVSGGAMITVAGSRDGPYINDSGPATSALLQTPTAISFDSAGTLYIAEFNGIRVRKVAAGIITPFAGNGIKLDGGDNGPALNAGFSGPTDIAADSSGNVYIADGNRIRKVSAGIITNVAGGGAPLGDNGPATAAQFSYPTSLAVDAAGNVFVTDFGHRRVRKISGGIVTTVASTPYPVGLTLDSAGSLYFSDAIDNRIYKLSPTGPPSTVAGHGGSGSVGDGGPATSELLSFPTQITTDQTGNLYILEEVGSRVRKVAPNNQITTVAGNSFTAKSPEGAAPTASLYKPSGLASDGQNLYIAENGAFRILKIANGVRTTIAGNGAADTGPAINVAVNPALAQIALDSSGSLYFIDYGPGSLPNARIRKISGGAITTIAGAPGLGFNGEAGPALKAVLIGPSGIAVDRVGNIYFSDGFTNRIFVLKPTVLPAITAVNNAASNLGGPIAPGEIVALTGSALGPEKLVLAQPNSEGVYSADLAQTSVRFNGLAAPLIYTSARQLAAIVPYGLTGQNAQVMVTYQGEASLPFGVAIAPAAPALFTADSTGRGQAAVLNQNGSVNSAANPAAALSYISLFATGEGQTKPAGVDGKPAASPLPSPLLPVSVTIGGQIIGPAQLLYAGAAPGQVAGLMQINVQIPANTFGPSVPVTIQVGTTASPAGTTISVVP